MLTIIHYDDDDEEEEEEEEEEAKTVRGALSCSYIYM
jgi:hypothetical protein